MLKHLPNKHQAFADFKVNLASLYYYCSPLPPKQGNSYISVGLFYRDITGMYGGWKAGASLGVYLTKFSCLVALKQYIHFCSHIINPFF